MRNRALAMAVAASAALLTVVACSSSGNNQGSQTSTTTVVVTTPVPSPGAQPHNQADVTFAEQMIPHHRQALQLSDIIVGKQGIDPRVVDLANQIKATEGPEIQQMQAWLSQWGQPLPSASSTATGSATTPGATAPPTVTTAPTSGMTTSATATPGAGQMPGMVSEQEITALQNTEGADASKLFLTMMIDHHQGAITMAQAEVKSGQNSPAIALAQSIITSQQQQIDTMQNLLASL
ncbi:MAG: DUF305 domain-containing protein [Mycobacteriaceae bacterium]|nr:DUF305 domain-containing protein [Mycobacteriaceae bacterium]